MSDELACTFDRVAQISLADQYAAIAGRLKPGSRLHRAYAEITAMLLSNVACYDAVQARCLTSELERDQARCSIRVVAKLGVLAQPDWEY